MSEAITIYHNPRCSKSRQTLGLIEEKGIQPEVVLYLETPPTEKEINSILKKLGITPRELLRKGENAYNAYNAYKELGLKDDGHSDADLIQAMHKHPKLIERPIVIKGDSAVLGRPPENVKSFL